MKPVTSKVKHAGEQVASLPPVQGPQRSSPPTILGVPCGKYVSPSLSPLTRMAAQDWIWIRPDLVAVVKIWNDGTWVWEHLSGAVEKQGQAQGVAGEPGNEYSAANDAQRALVDRAMLVMGAVK